MGHWKPSKTERKNFAIKMNNDAEFAKAYNDRKESKLEKQRSTSSFDYRTAGGKYKPTSAQYNFAFSKVGTNLTTEQETACNMVIYGYTCNEKIHHDFIHIVNELIRKKL